MNKIRVILIVIPFLIGLIISGNAYSGDIQLQVKDFECVDDGKIVVHYTLVNTFGFDYNNVSLCFKLVEDEKAVACKELKVVVPVDADGSKIDEFTIQLPCSNKDFSLKSAVFYYTKRYRIDEWFSECK
jgi:hypothetical protein